MQAMGVPGTRSTSNATRLLSAGAYLERQFRKGVIHELVACRFRSVAPAYGYDAVTVLAHALAARRLARQQAVGVIISWGVDLFLFKAGVISSWGGLLVAVWAVWAFAFLRRAATLQALNRVRAAPAGGGYPANSALTPDLVAKISREQQGADDAIFYSGYFPFVGSGRRLAEWSTAELLVPAPEPRIIRGMLQDGGETGAQSSVKPFTVTDITDYVAERLQARLYDEIPSGGRVERLTIERRNYSGAAHVPVRRGRGGKVVLEPVAGGTGAQEAGRQDGERYDATREYLCIRVGAWDEELVISMFVCFDLRGNTLYSEFHPCVLPPVQASFHLVDRLPGQLTAGVLLRVARHVPSALIADVVRTVTTGPISMLRRLQRGDRAVLGPELVVDNSDFRLGRYAAALADRGARISIRELAASQDFHHYFQEKDQGKYIQIVERQLLRIKGEFLAERNVDIGDHLRSETNIIDASTQNYSGFNITGSENFNIGGRHNVHNYGRAVPGPDTGGQP